MRIDEMTLDQLLELNDVICQRIDELKEQETLQALSQLRAVVPAAQDFARGRR